LAGCTGRRSQLVDVHLRPTGYGGQPSPNDLEGSLPTVAHMVRVSEGWRGVWDDFRNYLLKSA